MVGQGRVAGQQRAVRIGADHRAGDGSLGAVVAVADADLDRRQRLDARSETGVAAVVLEPGQPLLVEPSLAQTCQRLRISPTARTGPRVVVTSSRPRPSITWSSSPTVNDLPMIW